MALRRHRRFYREDDRYPPYGSVGQLEEFYDFLEFVTAEWSKKQEEKKKEEESKKKKTNEFRKFSFLEVLGLLFPAYFLFTLAFKAAGMPAILTP